MTTLRQVNAALRAAGHAERLARGPGYYYFEGGEAHRWPLAGVYVNRVGQLTVAQWLNERDALAAEREP